MESIPTAKPRSDRRTQAVGAILAACLLLVPAEVAAAGEEEAPRPRLSPLDFKVIKSDQPLTGTYLFRHPLTGESDHLEILAAVEDDPAMSGVLTKTGLQILTVTPKTTGVGWEGELRGILTACGQDRVNVTDVLPLGRSLILRLEADPPQTPCPFLEDRSQAKLVVAATSRPVRLRNSREIVSNKTKEQIGLAGQPGGDSTPIVAGAVSVEGGTELKYLGRTRSLDGSVWIEVEAMVSPVPGIEPPRGFMRSAELKVDATLTLERLGSR